MIIEDKDTNSHIQRAVAQNLAHSAHSMYLQLEAQLPIHMA